MLNGKIFVRVLMVAGSIIFPSLLFAGDFHKYENLICSDCHIMHYSKEHDYQGASVPDPLLAGGGPFPSLLKNNPANLCLSCHDGKTDVPDVYANNSMGNLRAAGALNKVGDSGSYAETNGHTIGSTSIAPGGTWNGNSVRGLLCQDCHNTHGNDSYRNLKPDRGGASSVSVSYTTNSGWVSGKMVVQGVSSPLETHYDVSNLKYGIDSGKTISDWCGGCHTLFHGAGGSSNMGGSSSGDTPGVSGNEWFRHPTGGITMGMAKTNGNVDASHWWQISGAGAPQSRVPVVTASGTIPSDDNQPFCGSCHKAHGSINKFGLLLDDDQTSAKEDGTKVKDTCQQCHYQ